jgi:GNAT superfamily N-acetyltransferase
MARAMHAESPRYRHRNFSDVKVRGIIEYFISGPTGGAFVVEEDGVLTGMIGGVPVEDFFGTDKYASDLVIYVLPEKRGSSVLLRLVRVFEKWCFVDQGVAEVILGISTGIHAEATVRVYERLGYSLSSYGLIKTREQWECAPQGH